MKVEVVEDPAGVAAELLVQNVIERHHIALAGGSTPKAAYRLAAERLPDWSGAVLWYGDDRCVPPEHEHSNHRMVRESLLDRLAPAGQPRVERILGELGPEAAAEDYERRLRAAGGRLDLVLLGLGPDAHTASLFPGKPELEEDERLVVAVPEAGMEPRVPRVTLTIPALAAAGEVVFLVAGADKAEAVRRAFGREPDLTAPAARVRADRILCDAAAASLL